MDWDICRRDRRYASGSAKLEAVKWSARSQTLRMSVLCELNDIDHWSLDTGICWRCIFFRLCKMRLWEARQFTDQGFIAYQSLLRLARGVIASRVGFVRVSYRQTFFLPSWMICKHSFRRTLRSHGTPGTLQYCSIGTRRPYLVILQPLALFSWAAQTYYSYCAFVEICRLQIVFSCCYLQCYRFNFHRIPFGFKS